ncbi:MAG: CPBP family intramembrane metalloprotease [Deltaproteobacteria bacterium]|nr:CPBP family intramembrane metalloprotease [Deltaproteobacteria bacterium]
MEAKHLTVKNLVFSLSAVSILEGFLRLTSLGSSIAALGATRLIQSVLVVWIAMISSGGAASIGLERSGWLHGFRKGVLWSLAFGALALCAFFLLFLNGINALHMIRGSLPGNARDMVLLFLVGGILAPLTEEMVYRGLLYGFFRRWGVATGLIVSTLLFVFSHPINRGFPFTQAIGGLVFAAAYEVEGNLLVPITIHILGNLAILTLSALA